MGSGREARGAGLPGRNAAGPEGRGRAGWDMPPQTRTRLARPPTMRDRARMSCRGLGPSRGPAAAFWTGHGSLLGPEPAKKGFGLTAFQPCSVGTVQSHHCFSGVRRAPSAPLRTTLDFRVGTGQGQCTLTGPNYCLITESPLPFPTPPPTPPRRQSPFFSPQGLTFPFGSL